MVTAESLKDPVFSAADVVQDDSDGTTSVKASLDVFAKAMKNKYPNDPAGKAPRPMVYDALNGLSTADQGISGAMLEEDDDGLLVIVPAYPGMKDGHSLRLAWGLAIVGSAKVTEADVGSYVSIRVPPEKVPKGQSRLRYYVTTGLKVFMTSLETITLLRMGQPGVLGAQGVDEELAAPVVELPASKVVGPAQAKAKVKVHIPAYLNKQNLDRITLFWGDQTIEHVVTVKSKADESTPVIIEVDESVIKAAGDSEFLPVYYFVTDEVGNESEWSADALVNVKVQPVELAAAPVLLDRNGSVNTSGLVDLGDLGADHLAVQAKGDFKAGDSIVLNWTGLSDAGQSLAKVYGPQALAKDSTALTFKVPIDVLAALTGGSARVTYTLTRNGVSSTSKVAVVDIQGEPIGLPAPVLNKDKNLDHWIEADHAFVHVLIPIEAALLEEDEVTVHVVGTASDASVKALSSKMFRMTAKRVGKVLPINLKGATFIKPFDGGWVDVSYAVKRGTLVLRSEVVRYYLGEPASTLAAPTTDPLLAKGLVDPTLPEYEYDMQIVIPADQVTPTPCTVTLYWETSDGEYYEDEQVLEAGDEVSPFMVPAEHLTYKGDKPNKVWVYYVVDWEDKPSKASEDFEFSIGTQQAVAKLPPALSLPGVKGGNLDLGKVATGGLVVEIPQYEGMAVGDKIRIKFDNLTVKEHTVASIGKQTINLTSADLTPVSGLKNAVMTYEVEHYPSGAKTTSQPMPVGISGQLKIPSYNRTETFGTGTGQYAMIRGKEYKYPAADVRLDSGLGWIMSTREAIHLPVSGCVIAGHFGSTVSFFLKNPVTSFSFDFTTVSGSEVKIIDDSGKVIDTLPMPTPSASPPKGYTVYTTRFSYSTTGAAVSHFQVVNMSKTRNTIYIDNLRY